MKNWLRPYWLWPSIEELDDVKDNICDFSLVDTEAKAKRSKEKIVVLLLRAFRQIELVWLILRFVHPQNFGIYTPPVAYLLAMPSGENAVDT